MTGDGNPASPAPSVAPPAPAARRGCFFYGCLVSALVGLFLLVLAGVAYYWGKRTTERLVRDYTDSAPALLERVELPREQMEALQRRLTAFKQAMDKGETSTELVLTAEELNALINEQRDLQGKVFVRIEDDRLKGEVSIPLPDVGPFKLQGRYLNGTVAFKISLSGGLLDVRLEDINVKSKPLPSVFTSELKKHNLAKEYQNDPQTAADIAKFDSVQITNGQVILRNKGTQ